MSVLTKENLNPILIYKEITMIRVDNSIEAALSLLEQYGYKIEAPAERFKPREDSYWLCNAEGQPRKSSVRYTGEVNNYSFFSTIAAALSFEKLRKQMAIQFEFLDQHDPSYVPDWTDDAEENWFVYYSHDYESWSCLSSNDVSPFGQMTVVYMPYEVATKFINMANAGLIEGLDL
jgi:hypothetical protein